MLPVETESVRNDAETQQDRAFLRERFLRFIAKLSSGQESEIVMQENVTVTGKLRGFDLDFQNVIVENLQTPYLPVEKAIMRSNDIISIHMKNVPNESFLP